MRTRSIHKKFPGCQWGLSSRINNVHMRWGGIGSFFSRVPSVLTCFDEFDDESCNGVV